MSLKAGPFLIREPREPREPKNKKDRPHQHFQFHQPVTFNFYFSLPLYKKTCLYKLLYKGYFLQAHSMSLLIFMVLLVYLYYSIYTVIT